MSEQDAKNGSPLPTNNDLTDHTATGIPNDLHNLLDTPAHDIEDPIAGLRNDPNYAALIRDLEYIAKEARKLFEPASEEPSDTVWDNIQKELDKPSTH